MTTAKDILGEATAMLDARASDRDKPDGERSMGKIVGCFNIATGHSLSERDGWLFMVFLKAVRAATTPHGKPDDYIDGPAYFALAGEAALREYPLPSYVLPISSEELEDIKEKYSTDSKPTSSTYTFVGTPAVESNNGKLTIIDREAYRKYKGGAV